MVINSCLHYRRKKMARIEKVSVPWTVLRVGVKIVSAFPDGPSTVDFMGDVQGRSIAFEAKSTEEERSFPLANFEEHQIEFLRDWQGIKFALIEFARYRKTFFVPWDKLILAWDNQSDLRGRKSLKLNWFLEECYEVVQGNGVPLDFLRYIDYE
ncbi:Holliday junction resolvase RecU [Paenibacillus alba]|uniref:Holliday junction resolvase RecU n=1 Tax=Paenibacillus alba TaxID=1197127 RepID=A0ABU6GCD7_9BACL|nr:Holliday junction resolvase RecU [Paenibacillus alba]MEC0231310.1 Holliday junction resolvase RecU [Paenibacillus alba]